MSVLIRGMEMPHSCNDCDFNREAWCVVRMQVNDFSNDVYEYSETYTKPDWCPLRDVPTPHSRLVDADALEKKIEKNLKERKIDRYDRDLLLHYLDVEAAPTIIEAEGET